MFSPLTSSSVSTGKPALPHAQTHRPADAATNTCSTHKVQTSSWSKFPFCGDVNWWKWKIHPFGKAEPQVVVLPVCGWTLWCMLTSPHCTKYLSLIRITSWDAGHIGLCVGACAGILQSLWGVVFLISKYSYIIVVGSMSNHCFPVSFFH